MQTFTFKELAALEQTMDKLNQVAYLLAPTDSKHAKNAAILTDIISRLRHAALVMQNDPENAELLMMSIIRPLQTA